MPRSEADGKPTVPWTNRWDEDHGQVTGNAVAFRECGAFLLRTSRPLFVIAGAYAVALALLLGALARIATFVLFVCTAMIHASPKFLGEWPTPLVPFLHRAGLDYVSCSPFRVRSARLAAAQAALAS